MLTLYFCGMNPSPKKRKTDFISDEIATRDQPVIAGITWSKFKSNGRIGKINLPAFFVRESGGWNDGEYKFYHPCNKRGYFVGKRGRGINGQTQ